LKPSFKKPAGLSETPRRASTSSRSRRAYPGADNPPRHGLTCPPRDRCYKTTTPLPKGPLQWQRPCFPRDERLF